MIQANADMDIVLAIDSLGKGNLDLGPLHLCCELQSISQNES